MTALSALFHKDRRVFLNLRRGWMIAVVWLLGITAVTTLLPLAAGRKSLMTREY